VRFLVFSVLSLSVARRAQQFALLGVLGLTARQRLQLVLVESALLGAVGSAAGVALGTGLAALALRLLGGDLGGGYFPGPPPRCSGTAGARWPMACWAWWRRCWAAGGPRAPCNSCRWRKHSRAWAWRRTQAAATG
jgi:ABC-type antimicrobial peptide transport system permease subunit